MPDRASILIGFALVFVYIVAPLENLLIALPRANLAQVSGARIDEITEQLEHAGNEAAPGTAPVLESLALRGVCHRYYHEGVDGLFTLGPIDLSFHPGQITYLVGGNGSGKTSLAKLLAGLYRPEQGAILLNGDPVDDAGRDCAGAAQTPGHAVAYLEDRPFLLFGEWAADQDPVFKEVFYRELLPELRARGKGVLVISHDDRYFHLADRQIRMENGQVVAVETPAGRLSGHRHLPI